MAVRVETCGTLDEAVRALSASRSARVFGGGTLLMRAVNEGDQSFDTMIRVADPALREIRAAGERIVIGAGVTMAEIVAHNDLAVLAPAARGVGGPAIRSAATVGGNLFAPPPYGDFATALLALGARIEFAGQGGSDVSVEDFMRDRGNGQARLVRAVSIPRVGDPSALRFLKVSRTHPKGAAVMTIAALLPRSGGRISDFRIAYNNMAATPVRAAAVERALEGASLDEAGIGRALAAATEGLDPPTDSLASEWYRREIAPVHLKRVLLGQM